MLSVFYDQNLEVRGPIGNNFSQPRFPVNLHQGLYLYVLDKPIVGGPLAYLLNKINKYTAYLV